MKPTKSLLVLAALTFAPAVATAQGYYGRPAGPPPPGPGFYGNQASNQLPGGFWNRQGRIIFGGTLGLGHMNDDFGDVECAQCSYSPISAMGAVHLGGFLTPRFALMGEAQVNVQQVEEDTFGGSTTLVMSGLMLAGQYWLTPQLWIKGGLGFANLQLEYSAYGDGIVDDSSKPEHGTAIMAAIGYELYSAHRFSIDLEGRVMNGSFKGIDNNVTGGTIGVGVNWF